MLRTILQRSLSVSFLALCLILIGCGGPKTYKVNGVVTVDGKALAGATVSFSPISGGRPASGRTDERGQFTLTTFNANDGAMAGEYKVLVTLEQADTKLFGKEYDSFSEDEKRMAKMSMSPKGKAKGAASTAAAKKKAAQIVPPIYNDLSRTPLRETVPTTGPVELSLRSTMK